MNSLVKIAFDWAVRCFGMTQMQHPPTRALRVLEEAAELAQACGVSTEVALQCLQDVYRRPVGNVPQEIGGVLMTIYLFCACREKYRAYGLLPEGDDRTPEDHFVTELRRVLAKPPKHFTDRNAEKINPLLEDRRVCR